MLTMEEALIRIDILVSRWGIDVFGMGESSYILGEIKTVLDRTYALGNRGTSYWERKRMNWDRAVREDQ